MAMVIGSNAVPAAITQVDDCTGCKFTASRAFLIYIKSKRGGGAALLAL
jgi:transcriptional regulator CtsR